jgi:hypothetical protein
MSEFKSWEELTHKEQLECIFWDAYKDAHGFRPRHIDVSAMTVAELEAELKILSTEIAVQEQERKAAEERSRMLLDWEDRRNQISMDGTDYRISLLNREREAFQGSAEDRIALEQTVNAEIRQLTMKRFKDQEAMLADLEQARQEVAAAAAV